MNDLRFQFSVVRTSRESNRGSGTFMMGSWPATRDSLTARPQSLRDLAESACSGRNDRFACSEIALQIGAFLAGRRN